IKENQSWSPKPGSTALGYGFTENDCLLPAFNGISLAEDGRVTKRDVSKCLSSFYDPLGKYLEVSMAARMLWRKVVITVNDKYKGVVPEQSYQCIVPANLVQEINSWVDHVKGLADSPVPR
ncbi:hypothetical protein Pmar_PMAR009777, partial [Perkinsus marinus ATCC 50983]